MTINLEWALVYGILEGVLIQPVLIIHVQSHLHTFNPVWLQYHKSQQQKKNVPFCDHCNECIGSLLVFVICCHRLYILLYYDHRNKCNKYRWQKRGGNQYIYCNDRMFCSYCVDCNKCNIHNDCKRYNRCICTCTYCSCWQWSQQLQYSQSLQQSHKNIFIPISDQVYVYQHKYHVHKYKIYLYTHQLKIYNIGIDIFIWHEKSSSYLHQYPNSSNQILSQHDLEANPSKYQSQS